MNHSTKMKAWWIVLAIAIFLVAVFLSSGCVTINQLPAPCKPDTVYIEKESPLLFNGNPYNGYPGFSLTDTSYGGFIVTDPAPSYPNIIGPHSCTEAIVTRPLYPYTYRLGPQYLLLSVPDTFYKKAAIKAQQITNSKQ